jgi:plasmid stabilization system protein ParE
MYKRYVIWSPAVKQKLTKFRSERFTPEESFDYISQFILHTESLLENYVIGKSYTEEFGTYKGISRVVVKKFRVYYRVNDHEVVVLAVLFPGEN